MVVIIMKDNKIKYHRVPPHPPTNLKQQPPTTDQYFVSLEDHYIVLYMKNRLN